VPPRPQSTSRLANIAARRIFSAFGDHRQRFRVLTRAAQQHFERRDWARARDNATDRLMLYRRAVDGVEAWLRATLATKLTDRLLWVSMKAVYSGLIAERHDWDLAETFFNSVTRRIFATVGVDPMIEFVDSDFDQPPGGQRRPPRLQVRGRVDARGLCAALLADRFPGVIWDDKTRDAAAMAERISATLAARGVQGELTADMLVPVFYLGKAAYLVGRLHADGVQLPLVVALRNGPRGVFVDAVLLDESAVSVLFSYTRTYFMVDTPRPHDVVDFLQEILPRKPRGELYISIGQPKQGKTQLYRDLLHHLAQHPEERFRHAAGTPGLVMVVFDLPGHDVVLKVMRDRFPPEKTVTPDLVQTRYRWVYTHDRAGRLLDAQSFEHLELPLHAFDDALLTELTTSCSRGVWIQGDQLVIGKTWIERRIRPLNLYLRQAAPDDARRAALGLAAAIRDLAACNIFPGDLLPKNFGVTRSGRVAFYDYDEVVPLTACNFRDIPEPQTLEQEMADRPWYPVGPDDVFPEEFPRFLGMPGPLRRLLQQEHGELFTAAWWRAMQAQVDSGKVVEFVPYSAEHRLWEGGHPGQGAG